MVFFIMSVVVLIIWLLSVLGIASTSPVSSDTIFLTSMLFFVAGLQRTM